MLRVSEENLIIIHDFSLENLFKILWLVNIDVKYLNDLKLINRLSRDENIHEVVAVQVENLLVNCTHLSRFTFF